jgi:hypothetical protein
VGLDATAVAVDDDAHVIEVWARADGRVGR